VFVDVARHHDAFSDAGVRCNLPIDILALPRATCCVSLLTRPCEVGRAGVLTVGFQTGGGRLAQHPLVCRCLARLAREIALSRPQLWKLDREPACEGGVDLHRILLRQPVP
jgi:hypothetical protein